MTKQYGINVSVWEINCIRFGFAGSILLAISVGMILYNSLKANHCRCCSHEDQRNNIVSTTKNETQLELHPESTVLTANANDVNTNTNADRTLSTSTTMTPKMNDVAPAVPWYVIPIGNKTATTRMTKSVWLYISLGVFFVTYISPTLYNYALFEISIALTLTLTSIGPFYAIPLSYAVQKYMYNISMTKNMEHNTKNERQQQSQQENVKRNSPKLLEPQKPSKQVWIGATFTVAGIVVLAYFGGIE